MKRFLLLSLIISLVLVSSICRADPLDQWHWINPVPTGNTLCDVAYGNGTWVAVGQYGTIVTSRDGIAWGSADSGTRQDLNRVAFGNGTFVAAGAAGTILRSTDGSTWTPCVSGTTVALTGLAFGRGRFAATGDGGKILFSLNGAGWKAVASGTTDSISAIVYDGVKFVAYFRHSISGGFGSAYGKILTSTDTRSWTLSDAQITGAEPACFERMDYGGGKYFMNSGRNSGGGGGCGIDCGGARLLTSSDGISWSPANGVDTSFSVAFGKGVYAGQYGPSPDGVNWNLDYSTFGEGRIYKIKYAPEARQFVAVGTQIWSSPNGTKWTKRTKGVLTEYFGIRFAGNCFVAVGCYSGAIRASSNGKTWSDNRLTGTTAGLYGIAFAQHLYVAVGEQGTILTSPDRVTWTPRDSGTTDLLWAVTYGKGKFVAVGENHTVLASSDGITWTRQYYNYDSNDNNYLESVAFGNNRFIAAGYEGAYSTGVFLTSLDGLTWAKGSSLDSNKMKVLFANGKFWMICYDDLYGQPTMRMLTSKSDRNWIQQSTFDSPAEISFANGVFFLSRWWGPGSLETSTDMISWTPRETGKDHFVFAGAAFGAGTYVVVGDNGAIFQSDPVVPGP